MVRITHTVDLHFIYNLHLFGMYIPVEGLIISFLFVGVHYTFSVCGVWEPGMNRFYSFDYYWFTVHFKHMEMGRNREGFGIWSTEIRSRYYVVFFGYLDACVSFSYTISHAYFAPPVAAITSSIVPLTAPKKWKKRDEISKELVQCERLVTILPKYICIW